MHRNVSVIDLEIDEYSNITALGTLYSAEHLPIGTFHKNIVDRKMLNAWWTKRSIPASRQGLREALDTLNLSSSQELIRKCFGLSLSDQYWVSPTDTPLHWEEINFFENSFSEDIGNILFGKGGSAESTSLVSPDNTADGNLKKKWKISDGKRILIKSSSAPYHQETYNEVIASIIAGRLGISHVTYQMMTEHGEECCVCEDFITKETELVSAAQVMRSGKKRSNQSEYEFYIECCENLGVSDIREEMENMLVLDYLIANTDRHLNNFGLIRDARTLKWVGAAPIFDCGNSLWFNLQSSEIKPEDDSELKTPLWKKNPTYNLKLVTDLSRFDLSVLDGVEDEIRVLLETSQHIKEPRIGTLCSAVRTRIELLNEIAEEQTKCPIK